MTEAALPDQCRTIANNLGVLAGNERHRSDTCDPGHRHPIGHQDTYRQPVVEWRGPAAFARAYGAVSGIVHHFGTSWGPNADQRVRLRVEFGSNAGLLYVYDPTWDEYAVIDPDIPLVTVQEAVARAQQLDKHVAVEDLMALFPQALTVHPPAGPEL